jgi:hypothetical protein
VKVKKVTYINQRDEFEEISINDIKVGDEFRTVGTPRLAPQQGKVTKIGPKNITYKTYYKPNPEVEPEEMILKTDKRNFGGAIIGRNNKIIGKVKLQ